MRKSTTPPAAGPAAAPPRPFRVRNADCAKCGGFLFCAPGGFPGCPACGRVRLVTAPAARKAVRP